MTTETFPARLLEELAEFSTCVVDSAIETFGVRLRNTGFADSRVRCICQPGRRLVGYAATARTRNSDPPMQGYSYYERHDWWKSLSAVPAPRVVVIQDVDHRPGLGAFVGEVHANILLALGCKGLVTNGAVRDVPEIERTDFQLFAGNVAVSHAYAHVFDFGGSVEVAGLQVHPGHLIHADMHGVLTIPGEVADRVPARAREILSSREGVIRACAGPNLSIDKLKTAIEEGKMK